MIANVDNCGTGLNADLTPEELGNGVWSAASNMRFNNGYAERFKGTAQVFDTPTVTPYFISPYTTSTARYWIHAGLASVFADDGVTRTDITGTAPTGGVDDRWTGGSINGVWIMNNGVDVPTFWNGDTGTNLATIGGWDATWRANSLRPFKNFIIALGVTKGSTKYPNMIKWSRALDPGAITSAGDWDATNPAIEADERDAAETPDILVDGLPMGDNFIIYKERSMYALTDTGTPFTFRLQRLPGETGMLARGCGVNTPLGHVVLTAGDVVLNTGQGVTSVANGIVRDFIFKNISIDNYKRSFVTSNPQKNEVWVCFPYGTTTTCNKACVWNWIDKSWSIRELSNVTYGAFGQINYSSSATTWASLGTAGTTWATIGSTWDENEYSPAEARLLMTHTTPYISLQDSGTSDFGSLITATLERTGMHMGDPYTIKLAKSLYPRIDGTSGSTVSIQFGASMYADESPTWGPVQTFTIGQSQKIDSMISGRFLAVRFSNSDFYSWRIKSFGLEYTNGGLF